MIRQEDFNKKIMGCAILISESRSNIFFLYFRNFATAKRQNCYKQRDYLCLKFLRLTQSKIISIQSFTFLIGALRSAFWFIFGLSQLFRTVSDVYTEEFQTNKASNMSTDFGAFYRNYEVLHDSKAIPLRICKLAINATKSKFHTEIFFMNATLALMFLVEMTPCNLLHVIMPRIPPKCTIPSYLYIYIDFSTSGIPQ